MATKEKTVTITIREVQTSVKKALKKQARASGHKTLSPYLRVVFGSIAKPQTVCQEKISRTE